MTLSLQVTGCSYRLVSLAIRGGYVPEESGIHKYRNRQIRLKLCFFLFISSFLLFLVCKKLKPQIAKTMNNEGCLYSVISLYFTEIQFSFLQSQNLKCKVEVKSNHGSDKMSIEALISAKFRRLV